MKEIASNGTCNKALDSTSITTSNVPKVSASAVIMHLHLVREIPHLKSSRARAKLREAAYARGRTYALEEAFRTEIKCGLE